MPPVVRTQLDYYAVLEITPAADVTAVSAAFRRLAWRYHHDHNHAWVRPSNSRTSTKPTWCSPTLYPALSTMPSRCSGAVSITVRHDHKYGIVRVIMAGIAAGTLSRRDGAVFSAVCIRMDSHLCCHDLGTLGIVRLLVRRSFSDRHVGFA